ncbi:MAG: DUF1566 domain-containing protein [Treponema bryantii]|nr:DUF1566 domain-containing protein [Treponema bryantii]
MNKVFKWIFAIFVVASVFCGVGCKPEVEVKPAEKKTGTIQGKAFYSNENVDNHSGIQITLVSTDGLRSVAYCESRGIATNARSVSDIKTTAKDGGYSFENIPVGTYTIWASSRNSVEEAIETNVNVRANEVVTANDLNLVATGNIKGTITIDGKTDGTLGLDVFIAGTSYVAKVGPTGNYEISKIPAGKGYMLCVQKGEYTTIINEDLEVKAKETIEVDCKNLLSEDWAIENEVQTNPTFKWLGEFATEPEDPDLYDAYYNTTDGCSYIWNGNDWDLLAKSGEDGADGEDGKDGTNGKDGVSITWKGSLESAPENPELYWVYYNTTDGCSYIWNGSNWDIIAQDGLDGKDGVDGKDGIDGIDGVDGLSIVWKGVYSVAPENPELNWAYFDTEDGCSYIWNGNNWDLLAQGLKPVIFDVIVPTIGENYSGEVPVIIKGVNLNGHEITINDLSVRYDYVSDTKVTAFFIFEGNTIGKHELTINCETSSKTVTFEVVEQSKCFSVGDILFTDGTRIKAEQVRYGVPDEQLGKAFGIVGVAPYGGGTGLVVGLEKEYRACWAPSGTTGYETYFAGISVECSGEANNYTFTGDLDGSDNWEYICSIDPEGTKDAATNYPIFHYANTYGETAGLTGTEYENGWYVSSIAELYEVYTNMTIIQMSMNSIGHKFEFFDFLSSSETPFSESAYKFDFYSGYVYGYKKNDGGNVLVLQAINSEQFNDYNYGIPSIASIEIPTAGEGYVGEIPITIKGENLKGYPITSNDVTIKDVYYVSDKKVIATVEIDTSVGERILSVNCGASSEIGTLNIVESTKCFSVGDILFTDGTRIKADNVKYEIPEGQLGKAFGIIGSALYGGGTGLVVGLQQGYGAWASLGTTGEETYFAGIKVNDIGGDFDGTSYSGYTFEGDLYGSDNWEYICSIDPEGTKDAATNYPIFHYANTYGVTAGLAGTGYENDWYVPSIAELYDVYINKNTILTAMDAVELELDLDYYPWYSSSQGFLNSAAYMLYFDDGLVYDENNKTIECAVFVLQTINSEQFNDYNYGIPSISSVEISTAGEGYVGEIPVTIEGENLKGYPITSNDSTFTNIQYVSVNLVKATVSGDGKVGERTITVNCGPSSGTGTLKVVENEKCFSVGDILFTDGTRIKAEQVRYGVPDKQLYKAFGVIGSAPYGGGTGLVVGLKCGEGIWAPFGTTGCETNFTGIKVNVIGGDFDGTSYSGYTFEGDLYGSDNWEYICSIDPEGTKDAATNYPIFHYANTYGGYAGLGGTEYENGWYVPSIAELYDVCTNKTTIQTSMNAVGGFELGECWYWSSSQGDFYVGVYELSFDDASVYGYSKHYTSNVLVLQAINSEQFNDYNCYGTPSITNVEIPTVGEGYAGEILVTIKGENFVGPDFDLCNLSCSGVNLDNVTKVNDSKITATVYCDGTVGEKTFTVIYGSSSVNGILKVVSSEKCYSVGDIILTDGTKLSVVEVGTYEIDEANRPIGVVAIANYNGGTAKILGLQHSFRLQWAPNGTTGYYEDFERIKTEASGYGYNETTGTYSGYSFEGDLDGSDNWEYICKIDPSGTQNASTNYPVFDFANTYGVTAGLAGTEYENGWYVPSIAELYDVYTNRNIIKTSMDAAGGFDVESGRYWSSSQNASLSNYACLVDFGDGKVYYGSKSGDNYVFVLQALNAE